MSENFCNTLSCVLPHALQKDNMYIKVEEEQAVVSMLTLNPNAWDGLGTCEFYERCDFRKEACINICNYTGIEVMYPSDGRVCSSSLEMFCNFLIHGALSLVGHSPSQGYPWFTVNAQTGLVIIKLHNYSLSKIQCTLIEAETFRKKLWYTKIAFKSVNVHYIS